jgi:diamine N-acetyltransferase
MIRFRKITKKNYWDIVDLNAGDNRKFVAPNSEFLLSAIFNNRLSTAKAIYYNKKPIGMTYFYNTEKYTFLAQFMIDKKYQGKGYGTLIFPKLLNLIKRTCKPKQIELNVGRTNKFGISLYKKNGFTILKGKKKNPKEVRMILSFSGSR